MIPCVVELYDNTFAKKDQFEAGVGDFLICEFSLDESGCLDFLLQFGSAKNIIESDLIKIRLHESTNYFFTGVVRTVPISGSTKNEYIYSGYGFNDYLNRLNSQNQTYATKTINEILTDLVDNVIVPSSPITKDAAKIVPPNITITSYNTAYNQLPAVLDALRKVANSEGDYICGIDQEGDFFFKARSTSIMAMLTVGVRGIYSIPDYMPEYINEPVGKIYLLDKDGVYINSYSSTEDIDINELMLTAPDIDNTAAGKWAQGELAIREQKRKRASIIWPIEIESPVLLIGDGTLRIMSSIPPSSLITEDDSTFGDDYFGNGYFGGPAYTGYYLDDTLQVKQVKYIISAEQAIRQIELGTLPVTLDEQILGIQKMLTNLKVSLGR